MAYYTADLKPLVTICNCKRGFRQKADFKLWIFNVAPVKSLWLSAVSPYCPVLQSVECLGFLFLFV